MGGIDTTRHQGADEIRRSLKDLVEKLAETGQLEQAVLVANCGLDQEMVCTDLRALPEGAGYYTTILVKE